MKYLFFLSIIFFSACSTINSDLKYAMSFGEIIDLNEYSNNIEKQLFVRLYRSPIYNDNCFDGISGVCQYKYFVSVSTFDEYPDTAIYALSVHGEMLDIKWFEATKIDSAVIEFKINTFTKNALDNNPDLKSDVVLLRIEVSPNDIIQL